MGPKVAVLGASGFIGNRLVEWLHLNDLADVRCIVRSYSGLARPARFRLDWRVANALDEDALAQAFQGCQTVFHAVVGDRATILGSVEKCYLAARRAKVERMVYLSSAVVHGFNPAPDTTERSALVRDQPFVYNVSKVLAEQRLRRLRLDGSVEVVVLRPCVVFGPRSPWWTAQIATDIQHRKAYLVDGGWGLCNTIYVDNLVQAMWLAATVPAAANQDFILTDGVRVTWRDLYEAVALAVGSSLSDIHNISSDEASQLVERVRRRRLNEVLAEVAAVAKRLMPAPIKRFPVIRWAYKKLRDKMQVGPVLRPFTPDPEIVALQQCRVQLPIQKARDILGYVPSVGFGDACMRTTEWLRFAFALDDSS